MTSSPVWIICEHCDSVCRSLTCSSIIRETAGPQMLDLGLAHQRAIGQLADVISGTARSWSKQQGTGCPQIG